MSWDYTTCDDVFNLWSEVLSSVAHGKHVDLDMLLEFNENTCWKPEGKNLLHKFFSWLGNLSSEDLAKLAKHILNHKTWKQSLKYSK